jgi:hypothetical protein
MDIKIPDLTKLTWQLNVALIGATFSIFSLIFNKYYIYYGFLTFLYGIVGVVLLPSIEELFPKHKWRNFIIIQGFLTIMWVGACLLVYK